MEPETFLNLFDSSWFELNILKKNSPSSSSISTSSVEKLDFEKKETSEPKLKRIRTIHTRSMSDQSSITSFNQESLSPDSVLIPSKLQTILSGKEVTDSEPENPPPTQVLLLPKKNNNITNNKGRKKKRESKSFSDLEFEELKGFMDLGFVFSEEDKDSSLASIIPGLQRLGKKEEEEENVCYDDDESVVQIQRPYLSEAWEVYERRKKENPLMNWKVPSINNEIDIKNSLRWWAHTVASTVRR